jgi:hypothetical protein
VADVKVSMYHVCVFVGEPHNSDRYERNIKAEKLSNIIADLIGT